MDSNLKLDLAKGRNAKHLIIGVQSSSEETKNTFACLGTYKLKEIDEKELAEHYIRLRLQMKE